MPAFSAASKNSLREDATEVATKVSEHKERRGLFHHHQRIDRCASTNEPTRASVQFFQVRQIPNFFVVHCGPSRKAARALREWPLDARENPPNVTQSLDYKRECLKHSVKHISAILGLQVHLCRKYSPRTDRKYQSETHLLSTSTVIVCRRNPDAERISNAYPARTSLGSSLIAAGSSFLMAAARDPPSTSLI